MTDKNSDLLARFEALEIEPASFGHRQHVQVAFEILRRYSYIDACARYSNTINTMATSAGAADKFNVTITFAFLSLIAQRIDQAESWRNFEDFIARNEDLLSRSALDRWYSSDALHSDFARTHFLLPNKVA